MAGSDTLDVDFDEVPAQPVGRPGAYVERPGFARGSAKNFVLGFGEGAALLVHPSERVIIVGGADIDHDARRWVRGARLLWWNGHSRNGLG